MRASRWWSAPFGRIGVRATLVAVVAMFAFRFAEPWVSRWAYGTWGIASKLGPDPNELAPELARLIADPTLPESDSSHAAFLTGLAERFLAVDSAFYVLDRDGELVYRSEGLRLAEPSAFAAATHVRLTVDGDTVGVGVPSVRPLVVGGERVGYVGTVQAMFHGPLDPFYDDHPDVAMTPGGAWIGLLESPSAFAATGARLRLIWRTVDAAIALGTALLLGLLASQFLSRRIVRLSRETRAVAADGLPGPFTVRGRDEIAGLAGAMNDMRARILELVQGLEARDAARKEWVAEVSHDLRTPLTALCVCLDRIELEDDADAERVEALRLARHDARRLQALTEDLVEAARLEVGAPLHLEPVLPKEVLRDAVRSVRPLAEERGVRISVAAGGVSAEYEADGERLLRACENLLRNAVGYARGAVEAGTRAENGSLCVFVRDDGPGFGGGPGPVASEAARAAGDTGDGARLGLLVVERVAEAHGGSIELENQNTGGAEVRIRIPARPPADLS